MPRGKYADHHHHGCTLGGNMFRHANFDVAEGHDRYVLKEYFSQTPATLRLVTQVLWFAKLIYFILIRGFRHYFILVWNPSSGLRFDSYLCQWPSAIDTNTNQSSK